MIFSEATSPCWLPPFSASTSTPHKGQRFATTFCVLKSHRVFYIASGKSAWELEPFLARLQGKEKVRIVYIDLSSTYRELVHKWFSKAAEF